MYICETIQYVFTIQKKKSEEFLIKTIQQKYGVMLYRSTTPGTIKCFLTEA